MPTCCIPLYSSAQNATEECSPSEKDVCDNLSEIDVNVRGYYSPDQNLTEECSPSEKDVCENISEFLINVRNNYNILLLNICHLVPKIDEVRLWLLNETAPNIAYFCETFLSEEVPDSLLLVVIDCIVEIVKGKLEGA